VSEINEKAHNALYRGVLKNPSIEMPLKIARRNYEGSRTYVIVNPLQGKHLPVRPSDALALLSRLGVLTREAFAGERLLCVGFAETATAIGAVVAAACRAPYIHTTREPLAGADCFVFAETHSRFPEQTLCAERWTCLAEHIDRVVFVEDEISTGKTILAIAALLRETGAVSPCVSFAAASLVNAMNAENLRRFAEAGIRPVSLLQTADGAMAAFEEAAARMEPDPSRVYGRDSFNVCDHHDNHDDGGDFSDCTGAAYIEINRDPVIKIPLIDISGKQDPRRGVSIERYEHACRALAEELRPLVMTALAAIPTAPPAPRILLLGAEECMYPALYAGRALEDRVPGVSVDTPATTRPPIAPSTGADGSPITAAYRLRSLYDPARETFIYNLAPYDLALILTDSPLPRAALAEGLSDISRALLSAGTRRIIAARWTEKI
jgi:hypothetical protein